MDNLVKFFMLSLIKFGTDLIHILINFQPVKHLSSNKRTLVIKRGRNFRNIPIRDIQLFYWQFNVCTYQVFSVRLTKEVYNSFIQGP